MQFTTIRSICPFHIHFLIVFVNVAFLIFFLLFPSSQQMSSIACLSARRLPYITQIDSDLRPFLNGIASDNLEILRTFVPPKHQVLIQLISNTFFVQASREAVRLDDVTATLQALQAFLREKEITLPDVELLLNTGDGPVFSSIPMSGSFLDSSFILGHSRLTSHTNWPGTTPNPRVLPLFSFQKTASCFDILFPYPSLFRSPTNNGQASWTDKVPKLVWRGTQTGGFYDKTNWHTFARTRLVAMCSDTAYGRSLCDAGFSGFSQIASDAKVDLFSNFREYMKSPIPLEMMSRYKYIASIDGNGWASRFSSLLHSNSVVLKQQSPWFEFFYRALRPYEHYIPISASLEDVFDVVEWLKSNDGFACKIGEQGKKFASQYLDSDSITLYVVELLRRYATLLRYNVTQHPQAVPVKVKIF